MVSHLHFQHYLTPLYLYLYPSDLQLQVYSILLQLNKIWHITHLSTMSMTKTVNKKVFVKVYQDYIKVKANEGECSYI